VIVAVDGIFQERFGCKEEEVVGRDMTCLIGPATSKDDLIAYFCHVFHGEKREDENHGSDGSTTTATPGRYLYTNLYSLGEDGRTRHAVSCRLMWKSLNPHDDSLGLVVITMVSYLSYCRNPNLFTLLHPLGKDQVGTGGG